MPKSDDTELLTAPRNTTTERIFIAATRMENDGKTTTSLALFAALRSFTPKVGFIKPVGQRFVEVEGHQIDEDSVLLDKIFDVKSTDRCNEPDRDSFHLHARFLGRPVQEPCDRRR